METFVRTPLIEAAGSHFKATLANSTPFLQEFFPKHLRAMFTLADQIIDTEPEAYNANREVVTLSILFHDIGYMVGDRNELPDHATRSEIEARNVLTTLGASPEIVNAVCHCVGTHRNQQCNPPELIEAKVLIAADSASHMAIDTYTVEAIPHADIQQSINKLRRDFKDLAFFPQFQKRFSKLYKDWDQTLTGML